MSKQQEAPPPALDATTLQALLESLTGQQLPLLNNSSVLSQVAQSLVGGHGLGYSQFNELLLNVGYDRVNFEFFRYLCDPEAVAVNGDGADEISSPEELHRGIDAFRVLALLLFGNVKYGFKALSRDPETLRLFIKEVSSERSDRDFRSRHSPLVPLNKINGKDAHLLGYVSAQEINRMLEADPSNPELLERKSYRDEIVALGQWNHNVYLTFDHLDVYVATSMREKHEYIFVSEFMTKIEQDPHINDLKLRLFDPTCAYCPDRLDKGLAEALMLKRAACTIYLAQESDTLGKDSELASTLAQGKPVIAFGKGGAVETVIPGKTGEFFYEQSSDALISLLTAFHPEKYDPEMCREQAKRFEKSVFTAKIKETVSELWLQRKQKLQSA